MTQNNGGTDHLSVGLHVGATTPLRLERIGIRLHRIFGVRSFMVADNFYSIVPRSLWRPDLTPAAKLIPTPDAKLDPLVLLGMLAERYRGVRWGIGVTDVLRRNPASLAQAFVTLSHLTRGRAVLGLGSGQRMNTEPYGVPFRDPVDRLEEALAVIRKLWESGGEPVDLDGPTWRLRKARFATPLYDGKPPSIWIAAHSARMLGLTGRYADGWYPASKMKPTQYRRKLEKIYAAGAEAGRDMSHFEPSANILVAIGSNRKHLLESLLAIPATSGMMLSVRGSIWKRHGLEHPWGNDCGGNVDFVPEEVTPAQLESARRQATPELLNDVIYAGNVEELVADFKGLASAGLRHLVFWNVGAIAKGGSPADLLRMGALIRRLQRVALPDRQSAIASGGAAGGGAGVDKSRTD